MAFASKNFPYNYKDALERITDARCRNGFVATKKFIDTIREIHVEIPPLEIPAVMRRPFSSLCDDDYSNSLLQEKGQSGRVAKRSTADGNSLFNAASLVINGDESFATELRVRTVVELAAWVDFYMSEYRTDNFNYYLSESYDKAIHDCGVNGGEVSIWTLCGLASVLRRCIVSVYPRCASAATSAATGSSSEEELLAGSLNRTIWPRHSSCIEHDVTAESIFIMWTKKKQPQASDVWISDHFVPLVPAIQTGCPGALSSYPDNMLFLTPPYSSAWNHSPVPSIGSTFLSSDLDVRNSPLPSHSLSSSRTNSPHLLTSSPHCATGSYCPRRNTERRSSSSGRKFRKGISKRNSECQPNNFECQSSNSERQLSNAEHHPNKSERRISNSRCCPNDFERQAINASSPSNSLPSVFGSPTRNVTSLSRSRSSSSNIQTTTALPSRQAVASPASPSVFSRHTGSPSWQTIAELPTASFSCLGDGSNRSTASSGTIPSLVSRSRPIWSSKKEQLTSRRKIFVQPTVVHWWRTSLVRPITSFRATTASLQQAKVAIKKRAASQKKQEHNQPRAVSSVHCVPHIGTDFSQSAAGPICPEVPSDLIMFSEQTACSGPVVSPGLTAGEGLTACPVVCLGPKTSSDSAALTEPTASLWHSSATARPTSKTSGSISSFHGLCNRSSSLTTWSYRRNSRSTDQTGESTRYKTGSTGKSLQSANGSGRKNTPPQLIEAYKGGIRLVYDGYLYVRDRIYNDKMYWRCLERSKCSAHLQTTVVTDVDQQPSVLIETRSHDHEPRDSRIARDVTISKIRNELKRDPKLSIQAAYESVVSKTTDPDELSRLPDYSSVRHILRRVPHTPAQKLRSRRSSCASSGCATSTGTISTSICSPVANISGDGIDNAIASPCSRTSRSKGANDWQNGKHVHDAGRNFRASPKPTRRSNRTQSRCLSPGPGFKSNCSLDLRECLSNRHSLRYSHSHGAMCPLPKSLKHKRNLLSNPSSKPCQLDNMENSPKSTKNAHEKKKCKNKENILKKRSNRRKDIQRWLIRKQKIYEMFKKKADQSSKSLKQKSLDPL